MKKIFLALAVIASMTVAGAQPKSHQAAKSAVEAAEAAAQNPKKAVKPATWFKLADAYVKAHKAPAGNLWIGSARNEAQLVLQSQGEKPSATKNVEIGGQPYLLEVYKDKNLYYNTNNLLAIVEVTKPVFKYDVLAKAVEAYQHAMEVDVKGKKVKDVKTGISTVASLYQDLAYNYYSLGKYAEASVNFGLAAKTAATEPNNVIDTTNIYNAGFTAWAANDLPAAAGYFQQCLDYGYYYEDGEVFAKLGDIYKKIGENDKAVETLEKGFSLFPSSQSILIGLINYYIESNSNTDRLFSLLDEAKKNEPNNASLYYVEGNIHSQLSDTLQVKGMEAEADLEKEKAVASYNQAANINPNYEFGYIGAGVLYYNWALVYQDKAAVEMNDEKYMALVEKFESCLEKAIEPFEKAFNITKDNAIKTSLAEYLKNIYYRFSSKDDSYMAKYKMYNDIVKNGIQ